ncbi:hypothetical protein M9434_004875 [Picochlorum sp. BPE23]|nr:hypothetical protein M9434_004875 [Picochlorum sp. BPE23]
MVFLCCLGKPNVLEDVGQLPNDQDSKGHPEPATPPYAGCKFVFDENNEQIIGIDNSGSKYAIDKPIRVCTTPYEERLEKAMQEEEEARKRALSN